MNVQDVIIPAGNTKSLFDLDAGTERIFIKNQIETESFTAIDEAVANADVLITGDVQVVTASAITIGDIVKIGDEKMFVNAVTVNTPVGFDTLDVTNYRGFDGSAAATHLIGATVCKIGKGTKIDATPLGADAELITIAAGFTDIPNKGDIYRKQSQLTEELLLITLDADPVFTFERNFTLNGSPDSDRQLAASEILIRVATDFKDPEEAAGLGEWLEIESVEGFTSTPEREVVETESDQRGSGPSFVNTEKWTISWDSPIVDPKLMGYIDQLHPYQVNKRKEGIGSNTVQGKEISGIMVYVLGQAASRTRRAIYFSGRLQGSREGGFKREQAKIPFEMLCVNHKLLNSTMIEYIPIQC